ncbi:MAG: acetolactate synthase large subunit [Proteobacteria bacterium]|nr:acetolactate synthase large subunit [Pseudomonadota bacterium]
MKMNGAESLVKTLIEAGVDVCFTNPGTSEMHFVTALDSMGGMRAVLGLFEGVVTGAADGYARMAGKPAATLLHLGPGLANGLANLHNAKRANSPVVNIIGDHATYHKQYESPLKSDVEAFARPVSGWIRTSSGPESVASDGAAAVAASMEAPGRVATLILPGDHSWNDTAGGAAPAIEPPQPRRVAPGAVTEIARILATGEPSMILMKGNALLESGLKAANRIAGKTGASLYCDTFIARLERGAGRPKIRRLPYFGEIIVKKMYGIKHLILVGTEAPVSFFAYPDKPNWLVPEDCGIHVLAESTEDTVQALEDLADELGAAGDAFDVYQPGRPEPATGALNPNSIAAAVGAFLPENAIVSDESGTSGAPLLKMTGGAPRHDWMFLTGGSIGQALPLATGAAVACPDRKVVCLTGDGGAMYTIQSLWTQARENLDVTTVVFSNRSYAILRQEFLRVGIENPGDKAMSITDIARPELNFAEMAKGMGVDAERSTTAEEFSRQFENAMKTPGPRLIEAVL